MFEPNQETKMATTKRKGQRNAGKLNCFVLLFKPRSRRHFSGETQSDLGAHRPVWPAAASALR